MSFAVELGVVRSVALCSLVRRLFQSSNFQTGTNLLRFDVWNSGSNPTGLRVEFTTASVDPLSPAVPDPVPEPATLTLVGTGIAAAVARTRKRRTSTD